MRITGLARTGRSCSGWNRSSPAVVEGPSSGTGCPKVLQDGVCRPATTWRKAASVSSHISPGRSSRAAMRLRIRGAGGLHPRSPAAPEQLAQRAHQFRADPIHLTWTSVRHSNKLRPMDSRYRPGQQDHIIDTLRGIQARGLPSIAGDPAGRVHRPPPYRKTMLSNRVPASARHPNHRCPGAYRDLLDERDVHVDVIANDRHRQSLAPVVRGVIDCLKTGWIRTSSHSTRTFWFRSEGGVRQARRPINFI